MSRPEAWGPWATGITETERVARLRSLRSLVRVFSPRHPLADALENAEIDPDAAELAWIALHSVPSVPRRRILATFAAIHQPVRS
jgi:hypothetical protein